MMSADLKNKFLVASPRMSDQTFGKTVIYIACYEEDHGALGVVVNREGSLSMREIYRQVGGGGETGSGSRHVGWGGPVSPAHGYVLHSPGGSWNGTISRGEDIELTVSADIVEAMAAGNAPQFTYMTLGCAGWAPGQLEGEISRGDWFVIDAWSALVFDVPIDQRYETALARVGFDVGDFDRFGGVFSVTGAGHA